MSSAGKRIVLNVQVDFADYWRATVGFMIQNWRLKMVLVSSALSLTGFLYFAVRYPYSSPPFQLLVIPGALIVAALVVYINTQSVFAGKNFLRGNVRYTFGDDGVNAEAELSPGFTEWAQVPKAIELKNDFLVFYTRERMYTIPKACFESNGQMDSFCELLTSKLGSRASLKNAR